MEIENDPGFRVRPIGWEETREILRPLYDDREHWILVAHVEASRLIREIERKYYLGDKNADFTLITGFWRGETYALCAFRKRRMRPYQLASLLRQVAGFKISDAEAAAKDFFIPAPTPLMQDAVDLALYLFDRPAGLAMAA